MYSEKITTLLNAITFQFNSRTRTESRKMGGTNTLSLESGTRNNAIVLRFKNNANEPEEYTITIPVPYVRNGIEYITNNEVTRAISKYWIEDQQMELDFIAIMNRIALGNPEGIVPEELVKKTPYIQQMVYGFKNGNASVVAHKFQKAINSVVAMMPLHETDMNSFVMNRRLIVIDKEFDQLKSPEERLNYQVSKSRRYFGKGWTSIGLSDGTLADKNYILTKDLRSFSPFGVRFHNPQRNLYSTLGMKGDEKPLIRSRTMQDLMDYGVGRTGWNWFTAFVDVPGVFEDQVLVDNIHRDKAVEYKRRLQIFGVLSVKTGDKVKEGSVIGIANDGVKTIFDVPCDSAYVDNIVESYAMVGNSEEPVYHVTIKFRRLFCDGFKVTNLHGNKGVIRMMDLGYATHPVTGEKRKIDIIVGAKTVGKRKNYGQIMEALLSNIIETDRVPTGWDFARVSVGNTMSTKIKPTVIPDDWCQPINEVKAGLKRRGFNECGTWLCDTHEGEVKAICGRVFWGVIKTPHDQLWKYNATTNTNTKDERTAGLKFSHIEFRGLETRFGADNPILEEIMSYAQGGGTTRELLSILKSIRAEVDSEKQVYNINNVRHVENRLGVVIDKENIVGTIVDDTFCNSGLVFMLPMNFMTIMSVDGRKLYEGREIDPRILSTDQPIGDVFCTDRIYLPAGHLRRCWRHDSGKFGMSELGVAINNIMIMINKLMIEVNDINLNLYFNAVASYFSEATSMLCGKNGEISTGTMSVRYPFSVKAVATLSTTLPKNTVEIHRSMAKVLGISNNEVCLSERFPCLGFMSIPPQMVRITDDPMCKYTIRASGNSLVCTNLDFDGDVMYIAAFHTARAKAAITAEWENPNKTCYAEIEALNNRKGVPHIKEFTLDDMNITPFNDLTIDGHAVIVEKNTGVKAQTGPVIALTYNIMRIVENSLIAEDLKTKVAVEMFTEKAAQSVFEQKHGGVSLHEVVMTGVCTGDVEKLVDVGFKRGITEKIIGLIKEKAAAIGINDLVAFHEKALEKGTSNIVSTIVRKMNRIYYASRTRVDSMTLLDIVEDAPVDTPSKMFKWVMAGGADNTTTRLDELFDKRLLTNVESTREYCKAMFSIIDADFGMKRAE